MIIVPNPKKLLSYSLDEAELELEPVTAIFNSDPFILQKKLKSRDVKTEDSQSLSCRVRELTVFTALWQLSQIRAFLGFKFPVRIFTAATKLRTSCHILPQPSTCSLRWAPSGPGIQLPSSVLPPPHPWAVRTLWFMLSSSLPSEKAPGPAHWKLRKGKIPGPQV